MDYLLRGLHGGDIAAAIRHPTLNEEGPRNDGLPQPRSEYKFVYKGNLPEIIAADLVRHSGEASTLPVMQIVCKQLYERVVLKGQRAEITEQDYIRFGRAEGAIDCFWFEPFATLQRRQICRGLATPKWIFVGASAVARCRPHGRWHGPNAYCWRTRPSCRGRQTRNHQ